MLFNELSVNSPLPIRPKYKQFPIMKTSRRSFGALLMGGLASGTGGLAPANAASAPNHAYPALAALAALFPEKASCKRLADAGLSRIFDAAALRTIDIGLCPQIAAGMEPAVLLQKENAADFRAKRVVTVGGFTLARTEAAAIVLRARPDLARARA